MSRDANTGLARSMVDEWARGGVRIAALAPGSRSTPLALALAADERIRLEVFLDERSAGFFALGAAKASGLPAVVVTTSGTAAANLHPAVVEASHARTPLIACTADRPPELRDTGAGQAIDQIKLFGDAVRWFCEVGVPEERDEIGSYWRSVACRAVAEALGSPAGPVHLNVAFREPLVPTGDPVAGTNGRADGAPWIRSSLSRGEPDPADVARLAALIRRTDRGMVVTGWGSGCDPTVVEEFAARAKWPVLADPISGARRGPNAISTYDGLLRADGFARAQAHRPTLVLQLGAPLTSKAATGWIDDSVSRVMVDPEGAWLDPGRTATERVAGDPSLLLIALVAVMEDADSGGNGEFVERWLAAESAARAAIDKLLDGWDEPFEGRVARDLAGCLPDGSTLVVASSMPVRDLESFARPRTGLRMLANRGVNGIDGFVSTVLGVAAVSNAPVAALTGDLAFLHDSNGLLNAARRGLNATFVVLDNRGGGIFNFLPQAGLPEHFESVFATPQDIEIADLARVHRLPVTEVAAASDLVPAVDEATSAGGVRVVLVRTDRAANVERHRQVWAAVADAVS